jgi:hypothetical protein
MSGRVLGRCSHEYGFWSAQVEPFADDMEPHQHLGDVSLSASVAVISESTVVTDDVVTSWVPALQTQVTEHFLPARGADAQLSFVSSLPTIPGTVIPQAWPDDRFDVVWTFTLAPGAVPAHSTFGRVPQQLVSGDSATVIPT